MSNAPIQEALKNIRKELLKYCHHKKCRFFVRCPTDHPKCKKKLGLDTAIAWQVARHIVSLLSIKKTKPRSYPRLFESHQRTHQYSKSLLKKTFSAPHSAERSSFLDKTLGKKA